ncbi:hypothetical protein [Dokdonia sp. Asnod2-E02]|uniref:hypothetical protein n=1 Tax=Dokdonia sp. Asnod2-E02 TaxID=3160574 RepID=UPI003869F2B5
MSRDAFLLSLKAKIETLFTTYTKLLHTQEQQDIIRNGFVFSKIDPTANVLVMGINPSLRTDFISDDMCSYDYSKLHEDRYFKKFYNLLSAFESQGITYCDLFYQRHTEQKQIANFLNNEIGKQFLRDQLEITKEVITYVAPRLILLFNRQGAQFFSSEWMDISLDLDKKLSTHNKLAYSHKLESYIYFAPFLGYRTPKTAFEQLDHDLPLLAKLVN